MLRRVVCALFVLALCFGIALAEEIGAVITKVEGNKITFAPAKGKERGPEKTMTVADNVKVVWGTVNKDTKKVEPGDALEGGLKHKMFSNISDKGKRATIVTDADNKKITEIRVVKGKKKQ